MDEVQNSGFSGIGKGLRVRLIDDLLRRVIAILNLIHTILTKGTSNCVQIGVCMNRNRYNFSTRMQETDNRSNIFLQ